MIVTTKTGDNDQKFTVGLNTTVTIENIAYMPDFQESYGTGWQGVYDPYENTNWGPAFDGIVRRVGPIFSDGSYQSLPYAPVKDNLRDFYDTGLSIKNTISLSAGDKTSKFYASFGNLENSGVFSATVGCMYTPSSVRIVFSF